jgi:phosphopantetheinyl transferase
MKAHEGRHVVLSTHQNIGVDAAPRLRAIVQCLVSQAMPFFEQDELALFHVTRCDASIFGQRIVCRHCQQKAIGQDMRQHQFGIATGESHEQYVERASCQFADQAEPGEAASMARLPCRARSAVSS